MEIQIRDSIYTLPEPDKERLGEWEEAFAQIMKLAEEEGDVVLSTLIWALTDSL